MRKYFWNPKICANICTNKSQKIIMPLKFSQFFVQIFALYTFFCKNLCKKRRKFSMDPICWFADTYDQPCSNSLKKLKGYLSAVVLCPPVQGWELREGQHSFFWGVTNHHQTGDASDFIIYQIPITACRSINENNSGYSLIFRKQIYQTLMCSKE